MVAGSVGRHLLLAMLGGVGKVEVCKTEEVVAAEADDELCSWLAVLLLFDSTDLTFFSKDLTFCSIFSFSMLPCLTAFFKVLAAALWSLFNSVILSLNCSINTASNDRLSIA